MKYDDAWAWAFSVLIFTLIGILFGAGYGTNKYDDQVKNGWSILIDSKEYRCMRE